MPFRKAPFGDVASPTLEAAVPDLATRAGLDDVDDRIRVDDGVPVRAGRLSSGWPSRSIAVARSAFDLLKGRPFDLPGGAARLGLTGLALGVESCGGLRRSLRGFLLKRPAPGALRLGFRVRQHAGVPFVDKMKVPAPLLPSATPEST